MRAVGLLIGKLVRLAFRIGLVLSALLVVYAAYLVERLDVSRESVLARARSVEAHVVPAAAAGPEGRYYDAALELPLSLAPERIPGFVADAFITREDQQFRSWWHVGVNPATIARALLTNLRQEGGARLVGGSTITMQLVKNVLLNQEQTFDRKFNEVILAFVLEIVFSKDEILAMYLNTAYFGAGTYGIEAAARKFFGRSVGYEPKVNMLEAAMLALSVQRPSRVNPASEPETLAKSARELIAAMESEGYDVAAGDQARQRGPRIWSMEPFPFRDMAMRFMMPPEIEQSGERLVVGFTIDTEAQLYADLAAFDLLNEARASGYDSSAIVVMEPDGAVAAIATGHDYDGVDLVRDGRVSPGSALKPFMYLCALEHGMRPDSEVFDEKREYRPGWAPKNFDGKYRGAVTLEFAFTRSLNTVPVALFDRYGADCFADALTRVGISLDDPHEPTAVLGSEYVSLLSLASAYATLANGGRSVEPYAVRYARTERGEMVYRHTAPPAAEPISGERPYCDLMRMLRKVTSPKGTGKAAAVDRPVWGKTGTSSQYRDALFAGFTGRYVAVVWLGRQAKGGVRAGITGGGLPAKTFGWLAATLEAGKPPIELGCRRPVQIAAAS